MPGKLRRGEVRQENLASDCVGTTTLASTNIFVGNSGNVATARAVSGDWTMSNTGVASLDERTIKYVSVSLTNVQIKALRATPVEVIAAPGASKYIQVLSCSVFLDYGSNALTGNASDNNIVLKHQNTSGTILLTGCAQAFVQATADSVCHMVPPSASTYNAKSQCENQNIVAHNGGAAEMAGNAGADTTMRLSIAYRVVPTGF